MTKQPTHITGPCGLCGRNPSLGHATVTVADKVVWLCHPDPPERDCYHEWTVYGIRPVDAPLMPVETDGFHAKWNALVDEHQALLLAHGQLSEATDPPLSVLAMTAVSAKVCRCCGSLVRVPLGSTTCHCGARLTPKEGR